MIALFAYGTLQQQEVQLANYGRLLQGRPDVLTGHVLADITIEDPHVVSISGKATHRIARRSGNPSDCIDGTLFLLTQAELDATDAYETSAYSRVEVALESGRTAFAYVAAISTP
jgi:gamma-glutamylcyclotransferase (GGCT)/AIG2-like uncharacterized protein YtfP